MSASEELLKAPGWPAWGAILPVKQHGERLLSGIAQ
jgi:hypothetical protein